MVRCFVTHLCSPHDEGHNSCRRDDSYGPIRSAILESPILDIHNAAAGGIGGRGDSRIRNRQYALSSAKLAGGPDSDVAARRQPLKHDDRLKASISGFTAIDLEPIGLNGDFELPGSPDQVP
jgi:hypothetical protein